jgi:hypothetical protein
MDGEINEIDWTHSKLRVIQPERMNNKAQFRSAVIATPYPAQGALPASFPVFIAACSKRMLTAIPMEIGRISENAETG